jgi:3-(methylthio)propanoyl-CoA dehydrogenase
VKAPRTTLNAGTQAVADCVDFIVGAKDPRAQFAGAVPFLKLIGIVAGGWQMARGALVSEKRLSSREGDASFCEAKIATARFYGDHVLVQAPAPRNTVGQRSRRRAGSFRGAVPSGLKFGVLAA